MRGWMMPGALLVCVLTGCATGGMQKSYHPYVDPTAVKEVRVLAPGGIPRVMVSEDVERDMKLMQSRGYVALGESQFNGSLADVTDIVEQARRVGAVLVLVSNQHSSTQTTSIPLTLPDKATTVSAGSTKGGDVGTAQPVSTGTSKTSTLPVVTQDERFDQQVVFYAESTRRPRCGLFLGELTEENRAAMRRSEGALVTNIAEGTPAFNADILPGDALLEVNGSTVRDATSAQELLKDAESRGTALRLKIFRRGSERVIDLVVPPAAPGQ